jgi:hypothetical protein
MRMARVNITVPDEVIQQARIAGFNVSRITTEALVDALDRRDKIRALNEYLATAERDLGPIPEEERRLAAEWADEVLASGRSATVPEIAS